MTVVLKSAEFDAWLRKLKDSQAKARILVRVSRLSHGNPGDAKAVGEGVFEMRIDYGPGYRVYFKRHGEEIALLLCGGDKKSQPADIARAKEIASQWRGK